jgi:hypothetical protein
MTTEPTLFKEKQRLHTPLVLVMLVLGVGLPGYIAIQQLMLGRRCGNRPMSDWGVAIVMPAIILLMLALAGLKLETRLYRDRLRIPIFPFADETLRLSRIARWEVRPYSPLKEYWGWGVRFGNGGDIAYAMKGTRGVQLVMQDGSRVLIGSQRPEDLASALTAVASLNPPAGAAGALNRMALVASDRAATISGQPSPLKSSNANP